MVLQIQTKRNALILTLAEFGRPYEETHNGQVRLDKKVSVADVVIQLFDSIKEVGRKQYKGFVTGRIIGDTDQIVRPIKRNNLHVFKDYLIVSLYLLSPELLILFILIGPRILLREDLCFWSRTYVC